MEVSYIFLTPLINLACKITNSSNHQTNLVCKLLCSLTTFGCYIFNAPLQILGA